MYNDKIKRYFFNTLHAGDVIDSKACCKRVKVGYRNQGVCVLALCVNASQQIVQARFKAFGNPFLIATLEWLCEQLEQCTLTKARQMTRTHWVEALSLPESAMPMALLVEKGLNDVLQEFSS